MSQRNGLDLPKGPAWSEEWCNGIGTSYKMFFFLVFFAFAFFCFFCCCCCCLVFLRQLVAETGSFSLSSLQGLLKQLPLYAIQQSTFL